MFQKGGFIYIMIEVIETPKKFIFVCNYKEEAFSISKLLDKKFPNSQYVRSPYLRSPAIFLNKDSKILSELDSDTAMEAFLVENI